MVMERALACAKRIEEGWCLAELLRENGELPRPTSPTPRMFQAVARVGATSGRSLVGAAERDEPCSAG